MWSDGARQRIDEVVVGEGGCERKQLKEQRRGKEQGAKGEEWGEGGQLTDGSNMAIVALASQWASPGWATSLVEMTWKRPWVWWKEGINGQERRCVAEEEGKGGT